NPTRAAAVPGDGGVGGTDEPPTGDAAVDEALTALAGLEQQPLRAHVAVFDAVHGALQDRLADAEA
ncbi:MAG TPA: hypothetical protein VNR62_00845, partial [Cellulomonas sp.]|nr:hypothetical protein [Cellulomonas sp.]